MTSEMSLETGITPINGDHEMEVSNLSNEENSCDQIKEDSYNSEIFKSDEFLENVPSGTFVQIALNEDLKKEFGETSSPPRENNCDQIKEDSSSMEISKCDEFLENIPSGRFVTLALNEDLKKEFGEGSSPPTGSFVTLALNEELKKEFGERSSSPTEIEVQEDCAEDLPVHIKEEPLEIPFESEVQEGYTGDLPERLKEEPLDIPFEEHNSRKNDLSLESEVQEGYTGDLPERLKEEPLDIPFEEHNSRKNDLSLGRTATLVSETIFSREARRNDFIVRGLMNVLHNAGVPVDFKSVASHLVSEVKDDNWSRRPVMRPLPSKLRHEADVPKSWE